MDWNWTVVKWQFLVSLELSCFRRIQKQGWMREVTKLGKGVKWGFFLHFVSPNLAFVRGHPSSTPRTPNTHFALEEERAENQVWENKCSLAEGCHHPHLSCSKRSQEENGLFFTLVLPSGGVSNSFPIDEFHFRRVVRDSLSLKKSVWKNSEKPLSK